MSGVQGKRIDWTPDMRERAMKMRHAGASLSAIGRAVGVSHAGVRNMLDREKMTAAAQAHEAALRRAYVVRGATRG
ncbi:hypothetical protein HK28_07870 [Acetobacter sp. DsW_063]|nr:hypothetical protein HK28_07870 [Acetobacter sp. DsW_063]